MKTLIAIFLLVEFSRFSNAVLDSPYTYVCEQNRCLRKLKAQDTDPGVSINICKLNCDEFGSLWPKPTGTVRIGKELVSLSPENIMLEIVSSNSDAVKTMLEEAFNIFIGHTKLMRGDKPIKASEIALQNKLQIRIDVATNSTDLKLSVSDESYSLLITTTAANNNESMVANISASTYFGARHALETLSQLIAYDDVNEILKAVRTATVEDKPVFPYRGIMLDTSRNYLTLDKIKKIIDGMSYSKLSVFHWHITDSHSWPMEVPKRPQMMKYGAYSPDKTYSVAQIRDLVSYAKQRGIKVIPEIDQPAHSGYGYQWGVKENLGDLVVCVDKEPWYDFCVEPPCGQLNLVNENVTDVIGDIFSDMMNVFDRDIFHMGGDEVDFRCYNDTKEVTDWMKANNYSLTADGFYRLWGEFQEKALQKLLSATASAETDVIMWTSGLTDPARIENYLDKDRYIIQIWSESTDSIIGGLLNKGYRTIFSNVDALYLDCGFQAWLGTGHNWCSPIKGWQTVYDNNPEKIYAKFSNDSVAGDAVKNGLIFGSDAPLWAEQVDDQALESRIWPRAAAHAERLWTHPATGYADAEVRMITNRDRLVARGIAADRLQPEYCLQQEGKCYAESRIPPPETTTPTATTPTATNPTTSTPPTTEKDNSNGQLALGPNSTTLLFLAILTTLSLYGPVTIF